MNLAYKLFDKFWSIPSISVAYTLLRSIFCLIGEAVRPRTIGRLTAKGLSGSKS